MHEEITVRHSEPEDYEDVYRVYSGPRAMADTLGLPFSSMDAHVMARLKQPPASGKIPSWHLGG